jgi:hypothetical protein
MVMSAIPVTTPGMMSGRQQEAADQGSPFEAAADKPVRGGYPDDRREGGHHGGEREAHERPPREVVVVEEVLVPFQGEGFHRQLEVGGCVE